MVNKIVSLFSGLSKVKKPKGEDMALVFDKLPTDTTQGIKHVFDTVTEYLKVAEQEKTNRAQIESAKEQALAQIQSQRDTITLLINRTFDERGDVLKKQFEALDHALASGNVAVVQASLHAMVAVIQTSPFKTVQEMQQALGSKDFVVRLE